MYFHISDQSLTNIFNHIFPTHTEASLHIKPSPRYIISCILSLAASSTRPKEYPNSPQPISLATGTDVAHSLSTQTSRTNSWKEYYKETKKSWFHNSRHQCEEKNWHNKEIQNTPWNSQSLYIGCICILPDAPL